MAPLNHQMASQTPWHSDTELSPKFVAQVIRELTPIDLQSLCYLGEGWDFVNWLVNECWVFRFPKRFDDSDTLLHEKRVLDALNITVDHPKFEIWVDRSDQFNRPFAGYTYLKGTPLVEVPQKNVEPSELARSIGTVLKELHDHQITIPRVPSDPLELWRQDMHELPSRCKTYIAAELIDVIGDFFSAYKFRPRVGEQVTTHNDLGVEHILVDEQGALSAVIDWADCATSNRFVDFAGIWIWGGDKAISAMLETYPVEPEVSDLAQIRVHGTCSALEQIDYAMRTKKHSLANTAKGWLVSRMQADELADAYRKLT